MRLGWSARDSSVRIRALAKIVAVIFIAAYIAIYLKGSFPGMWNDILLNLLLILSAAFAASVATMLWLHYERGETPRRIWRYFAIGLWLWTVAELTYAYLDLTREEVGIGLPDVFWVSAYIFFAHALFIQYRLLANPNRQDLLKRVGLAALGFVVLYLLVYRLLISFIHVSSQPDVLVNAFYPVADLFLAVIAIWLFRHFSGGAFARPWLGLLAFTFTDFLYAWIDTSGLYDQANSNWAALFDTTYIVAYLILGLGLLSQWAFLRYGLRAPTPEQ